MDFDGGALFGKNQIQSRVGSAKVPANTYGMKNDEPKPKMGETVDFPSGLLSPLIVLVSKRSSS